MTQKHQTSDHNRRDRRGGGGGARRKPHPAPVPGPYPLWPAGARERRWLWSLFLLAFVLRAANVLAQRANPFSAYLPVDQMAYDRWAREIAAGDWIGRSVFYQDPLYPYFLGAFYSLFGRALTALGLVQGLLGSANVLFVWGVAGRLAGKRAAWIAAAIAAAYGPFLFYDGLVLKTFLEVLALNAALWLVLAAANARGTRPALCRGLAAGAVLGLGSLARANYLALAPLLAGWLLLSAGDAKEDPRPAGAGPGRAHGTRPTAALGLLLGLVITLLPVLLRNRAVGGDWVLTTAQAGQNFYTGNHPENRRGVYQAPPFVRPDPQHEQEDFLREAERRAGRRLRPSEASSLWMREGWRHVLAHPGRFAALTVQRLGLLLHRHEIPDNEDYRFWAKYSGWLRWNPVRFDLIGPLAVAGLALGWRHRRRLAPLYLLLAGYVLSVSVFFVLGRYRLPAAALLLPFAAVGADEAWKMRRERDRPKLLLAAISLAAGLVLVHHPSREEEAVLSPALLTNLGAAHLAHGRIAEALETQRAAVAAVPQWSEARYNLGIALYRSGDRAGAIAEFRRVLQRNPDYAEAWSYLGNLLDEERDTAGAIAAHRRARGLQRDRGIHLFNLARILAQSGRDPEALAAADTLASMSDPEYSSQAALIRAPILAARGDPAGAAALVRAFLADRPDHPMRAALESALRRWESGPSATPGR